MQYIHAKVAAHMRENSLKQKNKDHFEIRVKEKAERNQANVRVIKLIAEHFKLPLNKVRIINGHRSPSKLLVIEDEKTK